MLRLGNGLIRFPSISDPGICLPSFQVALVFPNNDPVAFMVAFYGCLLAEVVPVPIEVPLSRKVLCEIHLNVVSIVITPNTCLVFSLTLFHRSSLSAGCRVL